MYNVIIKILFILSVLVIISLLFTFIVNDFDYRFANIFGYRIGRTDGKSMYPLIHKDVIVIKIEKINKIKKDDIAVFYKHIDYLDKEILVYHRVFEVTKDGLITYGDNNPSLDEWVVYPDEVIGKVVSVIKMKNKEK